MLLANSKDRDILLEGGTGREARRGTGTADGLAVEMCDVILDFVKLDRAKVSRNVVVPNITAAAFTAGTLLQLTEEPQYSIDYRGHHGGGLEPAT